MLAFSRIFQFSERAIRYEKRTSQNVIERRALVRVKAPTSKAVFAKSVTSHQPRIQSSDHVVFDDARRLGLFDDDERVS